MSATRIHAAVRRAVVARAGGRCEYCGVPEDAMLAPHEPDHVIGEQHGGATEMNNLAFACFRCNRFKGPNIATHDPQTGMLTPLFNPRAERWGDHFHLNGAVIEPLTPIGRGTVMLLRFNDEQRVALRAELLRQAATRHLLYRRGE
jgi:hypothetical protein